MVVPVKQRRRRGYTRVSPKHQVTLTSETLSQSGLRAGDELRIEVVGPGSVMLTRAQDVIERYAGSLPEIFPPDAIRELRKEWD